MELNLITKHVCKISKEVGLFIKEEYNKLKKEDIITKSQNSLVTYVDKMAEKKIIDFLSRLIPDSGFIAEENTSLRRSETYNWIIDPLDGTTNFIHGIPNYAVSIALIHQKTVLVGVVYEPNRDELFYAWRQGGAFLNERPIQVSSTKKITNALVATGFPYYDFERLESYMNVLKWLMQNSRGIRRIGSAAIDLAYVACGRFDAFYEYSLHPWDVAAGALIVMEAGGSVNDFSGTENYLFGKEIMASNKKIGPKLLQEIKLAFQ